MFYIDERTNKILTAYHDYFFRPGTFTKDDGMMLSLYNCRGYRMFELAYNISELGQEIRKAFENVLTLRVK